MAFQANFISRSQPLVIQLAELHRESVRISDLPSALAALDQIAPPEATLAIFLDYDGTLTPIVDRPEDAIVSESMRETIRALAQRTPVTLVSGRESRPLSRRSRPAIAAAGRGRGRGDRGRGSRATPRRNRRRRPRAEERRRIPITRAVVHRPTRGGAAAFAASDFQCKEPTFV